MIYQIGVAIGAWWQKYVAYIDLGCYYLIGLPLGFLLGFVYQFGVQVSCVYFFSKFTFATLSVTRAFYFFPILLFYYLSSGYYKMRKFKRCRPLLKYRTL
jgi:Na+-driven multidrug efflux pump